MKLNDFRDDTIKYYSSIFYVVNRQVNDIFDSFEFKLLNIMKKRPNIADIIWKKTRKTRINGDFQIEINL